MVFTANVIMHYTCLDLEIDEDETIESSIEPSLDLFVRYFYFKKFNRYYDELSWYLEPGAKEYVKEIEDKYLHNEIDYLELLQDDTFKEFLSVYYYDVSKNDLDVAFEYLEERVQDILSEMTLEELKDLPTWVEYEVICNNLCRYDSICVDSYIEERENEEEDDD